MIPVEIEDHARELETLFEVQRCMGSKPFQARRDSVIVVGDRREPPVVFERQVISLDGKMRVVAGDVRQSYYEGLPKGYMFYI